MTNPRRFNIVYDNGSQVKGNDKEEYTMSAVRENGRSLRGRFGEELWKVALEPECRTVLCRSKRSRPIPVSG